MSLLYNVVINEDATVSFTTDNGDVYSAFFLEYPLIDTDGNNQVVYNFDFLRNDTFDSESFTKKYDIKIRNTLVNLLSGFFEKREHATVLYSCYNKDGYARHRSIVFNQWCEDLPRHIDKIKYIIKIRQSILYSSILIVNDNPLKELILSAFEKHIEELKELKQE